MNKLIVNIVCVTKSFKKKDGSITALSEINLEIEKNEFVGVVGPSGCGKSTLLNIVAGFLSCDSGYISVEDKIVSSPGSDRAVVFQEDAVFPWMTVSQNILYGPRINRILETQRKSILEKYLKMVDLEDAKDLYPKQLSGGMKKRVDLARAYANSPKILLMDEPFGSLDVFNRKLMRNKLLELLKKEEKTVLFVTHDIEEAICLSDRIVVLTSSPGKIQRIFNNPFPRPRDAKIIREDLFFSLKDEIESCISTRAI